MSLPEFVTPVLGIAGPAALVFVIMRCFPHIARAVVLLLGGDRRHRDHGLEAPHSMSQGARRARTPRRHAARREGENATWRSSPGSTATPVTLRQS